MNRRDFIQTSILASVSFSAANAFAKPRFKLGYSAITWNGNDLVAINDITSLGFQGIQLRVSAYQAFKENPTELRKFLADKGLELCMFSSGNVSIEDNISKEIETHLNHAKFVKALGGKSIQITNNVRPKDRLPTIEELKKYARNISQVAKQVKEETGMQAVYHNHMHQLGETPEEVDIILTEMDNRYIKLLLDIAHYHQGGGSPAEAILKYRSVLHTVHLKDTTPTNENKAGYKFVELGQGKVDLSAVFKNLKKTKFDGWAIVELDGVPVTNRTPAESGKISVDFLKKSNNF